MDSLQWRRSTADFENLFAVEIWKMFELMTIQSFIPKQEIDIFFQRRPVSQRAIPVFCKPADGGSCQSGFPARIRREPAISLRMGTRSTIAQIPSIGPTRGRGMAGCRKSNGQIDTPSKPHFRSLVAKLHLKNAVSSGESPSRLLTNGIFF